MGRKDRVTHVWTWDTRHWSRCRWLPRRQRGSTTSRGSATRTAVANVTSRSRKCAHVYTVLIAETIFQFRHVRNSFCLLPNLTSSSLIDRVDDLNFPECSKSHKFDPPSLQRAGYSSWIHFFAVTNTPGSHTYAITLNSHLSRFVYQIIF